MKSIKYILPILLLSSVLFAQTDTIPRPGPYNGTNYYTWQLGKSGSLKWIKFWADTSDRDTSGMPTIKVIRNYGLLRDTITIGYSGSGASFDTSKNYIVTGEWDFDSTATFNNWLNFGTSGQFFVPVKSGSLSYVGTMRYYANKYYGMDGTGEKEFAFLSDDNIWTNRNSVSKTVTSTTTLLSSALSSSTNSINLTAFQADAVTLSTASGQNVVGGYFSAQGYNAGSSVSYGIYATAIGSTTNWAGYFSGNIAVTGSIGLTGTRVTKGWFTDLEVTNAIAGSITGNAGGGALYSTVSSESMSASAHYLIFATGTGSQNVSLKADNVNALYYTPSTQTLTVANLAGNASTVTNGVYTSGSYANPSWISSLAWSKISSTPTTISGYGITDGVTTSRNISTSGSLTGGGNLSSDRTLSLVNDSASPGNSKYYGTDAGGTKGFHSLPSASGITSLNGLTGATQTFTNDTNVTITSSGTAHALGWSGSLAIARGGTNNTSFTSNRIVYYDGSKLASSSLDVGSFFSAGLFDPAFGELYDNVASSTISTDGSNYVKWTGSTVGEYANITGSTANDNLTVNSGHGGIYSISYTVTFTVSANDDYYWTVNISGTPSAKARAKATAVTSTTYSVSGTAIIELVATNTVDLGCYATNGRTVTVTYANLNIRKISN